MILTVRHTRHRFRPFMPWFIFRKRVVATVAFHPSCKYLLGADQSDWNKLIGIGFFPHHQRNSYRFGWRYSPERGMVEIGAYWYQEGQRMDYAICHVPFNRMIRFSLHYQDGLIIWKVGEDAGHITRGAWPWLGYKLGPWFGGNRPAPHDMKIEMQ